MNDFRFVRKWRDDDGSLHCTYRASFWEADVGRRVTIECTDAWWPPVYRDGEMKRRGHFANTAANVSYYGQLLKAANVSPT